MNEKLMAIDDWRATRFAGTPPSKQTVRRWCRNGDLPSKQIGGTWYVKVKEELLHTGDPLVDQVLGG